MKAILTDIEGTTTPIDFVLKTLFPYSKQRIGKFVETHFGKLHTEITELVEESSKDTSYTIPVDPTEPGSVSAYLEHLIDLNRKSTPLKSIQGRIWQEGYESGELRSIVFDDVPRTFKRWHTAGIVISVFSSGSVLAQELLFKYTDHGDLTRYISNYFDTTTGGKLDAKSYKQIAEDLAREPDELLFCSDILGELDAARAAGYETVLTIRKGNAEIEADVTHRAITSFDELE
jgi:enolase-phosphatase E1